MSEEYVEEFNELLPNNKKKSKHGSILNQLKDIESEDILSNNTESVSSFLPSSMLKPQKKKKEDKEVYENESYDPDNWFNEMVALQTGSVKGRDKAVKNLFDSAGITGKKRKHKKEKNKNGIPIVNYKKEFEPEMTLYKNLQMEQSKFVESLQKQYDYMVGTKGSARGINKQLTDLIDNLNGARTLSMQLIEKNVNAKKLIAELNMKQNKELGIGSNEGADMSNFASNYLRKMLAEKSITSNGEGGEISDYTEDEMFDELSSSLELNEGGYDGNFSPNEESDLYLKYENSNVKVYTRITNDDVENYEFVAIDDEGNEIPDYPLPFHSKISINRSTNIATDTYGKKYGIIWN